MLVEVALPVPVPRTFTYRAPDGTAPGVRVRVPFARRRLIGWVVAPADPTPELDRVLDVDRVLDADAPSVTPELLELCRWIADYYVTPLGIVIRAALPAALSQAARAAPPAHTVRVLRLTGDLPSLSQRDELFGRAHRQRECYEALEAAGGESDVAHLTEQLSFTSDVLRKLVARGLAQFVERRVQRDPFASMETAPPARFTLTAAQDVAVRAIVSAASACGPAREKQGSSHDSAPKPFLLMGVTGSGKTLVYIELLEEVVRRQGRGGIVLVPEIALTPQTVSRFRSHFGDAVAVLHSGLSDGERYDAWRSLRLGEKSIAIGARSAVFAPLPRVGAIIVDEEHESTYKQSDSPRYHAREIAVVRARLAGAVCVLGSATPALESYHNTRLGKYTLLVLPERVAGRPLPSVRVVDLRTRAAGDKRGKGEGPRERAILSVPLTEAIHERLGRGEQTILLLNRRGYATFVQCRACGAVWHCQDCNVSLTYHRSRRRLVCHYCFREEHPPTHCDRCGSGDLSFRGVGTEQVEREVADTFPAARLARMDVDTTSAKWSHHEILTRVERREVDILLGTQMIAKGLDFPGVTLVGVVNADVAMNLPDFRASERTFQLLTQVAGRAGRGEHAGVVIVQTALPQHYAIRCALDHDYLAFAERELNERSGPAYPPHTRLANVVLSATDERVVQDAAADAATWVDDLLARMHSREVQLTGPAPCPIDKIRGRWRWHFLLRSRRPAPLGSVCRLLQTRYRVVKRAELRMIVDRDPVSLL